MPFAIPSIRCSFINIKGIYAIFVHLCQHSGPVSMGQHQLFAPLTLDRHAPSLMPQVPTVRKVSTVVLTAGTRHAFTHRSCACSTVSAWRRICARCLSFSCCTVSALRLMRTCYLAFSPRSCAHCTDSACLPACSRGRVTGGGSSSLFNVGVAIAPSVEPLYYW